MPLINPEAVSTTYFCIFVATKWLLTKWWKLTHHPNMSGRLVSEHQDSKTRVPLGPMQKLHQSLYLAASLLNRNNQQTAINVSNQSDSTNTDTIDISIISSLTLVVPMTWMRMIHHNSIHLYLSYIPKFVLNKNQRYFIKFFRYFIHAACDQPD